MNFLEVINDRGIKPKEKNEILSQWILNHSDELHELLDFAESCKPPAKATCIEAIEYASQKNPAIASLACLAFVSKNLSDNLPRIKWESARVVGNIAHLYPASLDEAIRNLLKNTEHTSTVVRWSAAFALGEIVKLKTNHNTMLVPAIKTIIEREEKNSIKKIYQAALKKASN